MANGGARESEPSSREIGRACRSRDRRSRARLLRSLATAATFRLRPSTSRRLWRRYAQDERIVVAVVVGVAVGVGVGALRLRADACAPALRSG